MKVLSSAGAIYFLNKLKSLFATKSVFGKSGSGASDGLVPSPGTTAGTTKYLREDGTWQVPPNTDTNTHSTTHLYAGSGTASNATTTNGNTKITVTDDSTVRNSVTIKGAGATTVSSDASGNITINSANTTYSNMTAATASTSGNAGLVPAPGAGKQGSFLRGDGTWDVPPDTNTHYTSHLYAGSGSAANASTTNGNTKITLADDSTVRNSVTIKGTGATTVTSDASGNITINSTDNNTTYSDFVKSGSTAAAGLVPKPSTTAGTTKYLREDGTWTVPPDHTYSAFTGANGTDAGAAGLVPKPAAAANVRFLRGDGTWAAIAAKMLSDSSVAANGYIKFGNGLIIQWGTTSSLTYGSEHDITLPIAFSVACYSAVGTNGNTKENCIGITAVSKSKITVKRLWTGDKSGDGPVRWIAIGK